ncbi:LacI family transcriptional regulator [Fodinisporobacter ferrooxydans]|uniref:LacI family transcriptional regulator n=1 Tax=Fodinisporobacter ferrooxydans TaxID=2901836 RepID=A0ABY4CKH0_9BACL|nr:LacI family transcriptional regulator [Alicyclobacillaceae bacterium MYW30-H2]
MVTMKQVAEKSGFSVATVSAVINNLPVVSEKAKVQILKAIEELGYRPNVVARSMKTSKTSSIGIIVRDITNPFYPKVISSLEEVAWSYGYEVFLCNTENNVERERKYIDNLIGKRVDGIIITTAQLERDEYYEKLRKLKIPYVFLNRKPEQLLENEFFVGTDNCLAVEKVIAHLANMGYKKISFLCGQLHLSTFRERYDGFLKGMKNQNLEIEQKWICIGDYSQEKGYEYAQRMLKDKNIPEVIVCSSDLLAFGVYTAFKENGIRIPEDVALTGLDNNPFGHLIDLSSVDMQHKALGEISAKILMELLNQQPVNQQTREILLEPQLVLRKSCGVELHVGRDKHE